MSNTEEHMRLLAIAFYKELEFLDPYNVGSPMLDCKRPFGNSGYEVDILEIIGIEPDEEEDGGCYYSESLQKYARELYTEKLTPYLKSHGIKYFNSLNPQTPTP